MLVSGFVLLYGPIYKFYDKNCQDCDHLGCTGWGIYLALWKCDFYGDSLLPIVSRVFVKLIHQE